MNQVGPSIKKFIHPTGMFLGILFGIVLSATLQWIRDGGVVPGVAIGLVLGVAVFGPALSLWMSRKTKNTP